jgi:hypothetical protein
MSAFYDIWIGGNAPSYKRGSNNDWRCVSGDVWFSLPGNGDFITEVENEKHKLVLIGQLYEKIDKPELLNRCISYIHNQENKYNDPAGHYIIFVTSLASGDVYVFTNRMGSYHAYWSEDKAISTNYLALAKAKTNKKLNWEGTTGFMAMGYFPNDTTYLQGINIFEPACYYHFDSDLNLVKKKRWWQWEYKPTEKPAESSINELKGILQSSLAIATNNKRTVIPVSGGLDSRLLAGELTSGDGLNYKSLQALCYGYTADSPEIQIGKQIAKARHLPIHAYQLPDYLFEQLDEIAEAVELFQYVDGTRQASATDWLKHNADVVVGGHWGDVWMDSMNIEEKADLVPAFQKKIIKKGSQWLLDNICQQHVKDSSAYLNDYFQSFVSQYSHIDSADFLMKIYKTDQWSFRWTAASLRMYQAAVMPVLPFYDKRIVDLFCTIPGDSVKNRELQIAYLKQYHEDLARITWQEYDADLYNYKYFNNRNVAYRAVKKIQRTITKTKPVQRNWEVFYLNAKGKSNLEQRLLGNQLLNEIVVEHKIKALLDDLHNHPTAANGYTVSMLLTFAVFLDKVFK